MTNQTATKPGDKASRPAGARASGASARGNTRRGARAAAQARKRWVVGGFVVVVAILFAVVFVRGRDSRPPAGVTAASGSGVSGSAVGETPAVLTVSSVSGASLRIPATGKPTALYFSAAWCTNCVPEAQAWDRIQRSVGDRVSIAVVDADPSDTPERLLGFANMVGNPQYPFVIDHDGALAHTYAMASLDTTVIVDASGKVIYRDQVPTPEATLRDALAKAGVT